MTQVYLAQLLTIDGARWLLDEPTVDQLDPDMRDVDDDSPDSPELDTLMREHDADWYGE